MMEHGTSRQTLDNLVCALAHLRGRYGSAQISLDCFIQHAEVALFLEQNRLDTQTLSQAFKELQMMGRIRETAGSQARELSDGERLHIDRSIDSIFDVLHPMR